MTSDGMPYITDADIVFECRIISEEYLHKTHTPTDVRSVFYKNADYHTLFFGEILREIRTQS